MCFFLGLLAEGDAIAERLSARLEPVGPSVALAVTIISRSAIHGYSNRPESAHELAEQALTMLAADDVPTWRTLAEWQVARYSDTDPIELSDRVRGFRDRYLQVGNSFLAATASRQLVGLDSARASAQSKAMLDAAEAIAKVSMADPREAIGWIMQSAILLLRAGHHHEALSLLGFEERNRVTPVHPDQIAAIERLMPAVRQSLDEAAIEAATDALSTSTLRDALEFTKTALTDEATPSAV